MRVLIAGAGAIGSMLGARLLLAGHDVDFLARSTAARLTAGLQIAGHTEFDAPVQAISSPSGHYDVAVITSKAHATASLAKRVAPHCELLCSLQNGFANDQKIAAVMPDGAWALALTSHGLAWEGERLWHVGFGKTQVGGPGADILESLLRDAKLDPHRVESLRPLIWQKALVNHGLNTVASLFDVPNGNLLEPEPLGLCERLIREGHALATRARVELPADPVEVFRTVVADTKENSCSMREDFRARRATELEQISGRLVRLGEQLLVSMPVSDSVYGRLKDKEVEAIGSEASRQLTWDELAFTDPF